MSHKGLLYPDDDNYLKQVKDRGYFILVDSNAENISLLPGGHINNIIAANRDMLFIFGKHIAGTRQDISESLRLSGLDIGEINNIMSCGISVDNINLTESQQWIDVFRYQNTGIKTRVVCVRVNDIRPRYSNLKQWMSDPNNVYIGRRGVVLIEKSRFPEEDSIWANPFKIAGGATRETVINMYRDYINEKLNRGEISRAQLLQLKGKTLGCWCKEGGQNIPCHGDVLVELLNNTT